MYKSSIYRRFSTICTALFYPYIAHEQTAQNLILSVRSSLFALFLIERHRSQNAGLLKSEERLSDFKERCAQLWQKDGEIFICNDKKLKGLTWKLRIMARFSLMSSYLFSSSTSILSVLTLPTHTIQDVTAL